ncbi:MAG: hypothetical protein PWQ06_2872, partial [Anaerophaga sp.]|nr:hypothetical protein [Anaerophaga sp.]
MKVKILEIKVYCTFFYKNSETLGEVEDEVEIEIEIE